MRIFVSCTTDDLGMFRDALCDRPEDWWGSARGLPQFSSMKDAKAESIPPVDWSIREASRADLLVLLLGQHHGALAEAPDPRHCGVRSSRLQAAAESMAGWSDLSEPRRFSYTQWEVLAAIAAHVPILVFSPDRKSNDKDLQACRRITEAEWLQKRQAHFSQQVRSRYAEDHFANRLDLINKVRKAILRYRRKRRVSRVAMAAFGLLVIAGAVGGVAREWRTSAERARSESRRAYQSRQQLLHHKYAVAVGGALAMLGHSSVGAGRPVLEKALFGLGMPQNQVGELSAEYNSLDGAVYEGRLDPAGFQAGKSQLGAKVLARLNVIRPALAGYIEFGQSAADLLLLLRFWDAQPNREALLPTAQAALRRFEAACGQVPLPDQLQRRVRSLHPSDLAVPEQRAAAVRTVRQCMNLYEMAPAAPDHEKESN